ncbi:MAG: ribonuclease HI [Planctomycetota bacterium]|nr:ribonuclease HI [Planctomycetota bacterium]
MREVTIYCDGACRGNPGLGAYGVILVCDHDEKELDAVVERTTNNRMELQAAIAGLETLTEPCKVRVVTDSQYVCRGMTEWVEQWEKRGWKTAGKKDVMNRDLWERLIDAAGVHEVDWEWVRGHQGHPYNERCDRLANQAIDAHLSRS